MNKLAVPLLFLAVAYALFFGYLVSTYEELPPRVASHFDLYGNANGWMSRASATGITVAIAVIVPAVIIGSMGGAGRIPISFINLPHRDYWLAPERRQAALGVLLRFAIGFAALNVVFLTGLQALIVEANRHQPYHLDMRHFAYGLAIYLVLTALWTLLLLRRFSKV